MYFDHLFLLVLLRPQSRVGIRDADTKLRGALDQRLSVLGADAVRDLGAKLLVLHHQNFELLKQKQEKRFIKCVFG